MVEDRDTSNEDSVGQPAPSQEPEASADQDGLGTKAAVVNRKTIIGVVVVVAILAVAGFFAIRQAEPEPEPIKVGVIEEFQIEKETRKEALQGMRLYVDEINERGGVGGRKIELIVAEYEPRDEEHALSALAEIERIHHPLVYLSVGSDVAELTAAFAEEHEVVYFTVTSARDVTEGREWAFRYGVQQASYFRIAGAAAHILDIEDWAILYNTDLFFGSLFPTITGEMLGRPSMNVEAQSFADDDTDYRDEIRAISDNDLIFFYTLKPDQAQDIVRQMRELDYKGHIFSIEVFANPFSTEIPEFEGVYSSATTVFRPNFIFAKELRERFDEVYGSTVYSFFNEHAAQGYDIVRLITELLENEEPTRENLKNVLNQGFTYDSIFGNINLPSGEHYIEVPFFLTQYVEGGLEYLQ